jgi:uncharacterized damage-inducible protein DinB
MWDRDSEATRIADQLRRALMGGDDEEAQGEAWHGPAVETLLLDVDAAQAAAHPIPGAHSIWEILRHMTVWLETVRVRVVEDRPCDPTARENWAEVTDTSEAAWQALLERHRRAGDALEEVIEQLPDRRLELGVAGKAYNGYVMLHGIVQHELYHAGQIALLKRALGLIR